MTSPTPPSPRVPPRSAQSSLSAEKVEELQLQVLDWYAAHARDLPWRAAETTPWGVLVSEVMLQQTPVARVLPVWSDWMSRWPTPARLAADRPGEAVRAWGRLGYPRRALRLHQAAVVIRDRHGGSVPSDLAQLRALPGIGDYTASAVASFAFGQRQVVLDTNVRRVLARLVGGEALPAPHLTTAERDRAAALLPDAELAPLWAVGTMELGALVCTASQPRCHACPVAEHCRWRAADFPAYDGSPRRVQGYAGTDRQCRGRLLAVLREADGPVESRLLETAWAEDEQRARCLQGLLDDGLVVRTGPQELALP